VSQGSYYWQPAEENCERRPEESGERRPEDNGVRLEPPVRSFKEPPRSQPRMPRVDEKSNVTEKPKVTEETDDGDQASPLPVGIAQFAVAREGVTSGLKPSLDGFDWLKEKGYRTVLHVRKPKADDSGDRKQAQKRGFKFVSLEVSPATLTAKVIKDFTRIIQDNKGYPLFVYDEDGALAGGLWYLYFRTVENDSDESARVKASRLGLKEDGDGDHLAMWTAIQKYLSRK
jgi:hypothetical protein